jgi:hypothetical protein
MLEGLRNYLYQRQKKYKLLWATEKEQLKRQISLFARCDYLMRQLFENYFGATKKYFPFDFGRSSTKIQPKRYANNLYPLILNNSEIKKAPPFGRAFIEFITALKIKFNVVFFIYVEDIVTFD